MALNIFLIKEPPHPEERPGRSRGASRRTHDATAVRHDPDKVRMKIATLNGEVNHYAPEYEDCRRIAEQHQVPLKQVMLEAARLYAAQAKDANSPR